MSFFSFIGDLLDAVDDQKTSSEARGLLWQRFGAISTYCCSLYGALCLAMALIINRTLILALTNARPGRMLAKKAFLRRITALLLRGVTIAIQLYNGYSVLVALWTLAANARVNEDVSWVTRLVPFLFEYRPEWYGHNRFMQMPKNGIVFGPTTQMFWPIYLGFCFLLFVETLLAVVEARKPYTETGFTLFEHLYAFYEVSYHGGFFLLGLTPTVPPRPTEVMLIFTLLLVFNHLNIHIGALLNGNKYRLVPLTIIGLLLIAQYVVSFGSDMAYDVPFIIICALSPQVLVLTLILVLAAIIGVAAVAHGDFRDLNYSLLVIGDGESALGTTVSLDSDFSSAILHLGVMAVVLAGKSSYISELSTVSAGNSTWIESSVWDQLQLVDSASNSDENVLQYLRDHDISGYANVINTPSRRLVTGRNTPDDVILEDDEISSFRRRSLYMNEMYGYFFLLLYMLVRNFVLIWVPEAFKEHILRRPAPKKPVKDVESIEEFEQRLKTVPKFLWKYVERRKGSSPAPVDPRINLDDIPDGELADHYARILQGKEISEIDNSEDYVMENTDLESDSDIESVDLSAFQFGPAISTGTDLVSAEEYIDLVTSPGDMEILRQHLNYEHTEKRPMTRSLFRNLSPQADEASKLVELILSKRKPRQQIDSDDEEDILARLACVICQTNAREIITWPCKCFAICEGCRVSLVSKGFEGCVTCRRDVKGVSKVYIP